LQTLIVSDDKGRRYSRPLSRSCRTSRANYGLW